MGGVEPKFPFWSSSDWWELRFTVIQEFQRRIAQTLEKALGSSRKEEYARHFYRWFIRVGKYETEPVLCPYFLVNAVEEKLIKDFDGLLSQKAARNLSICFGHTLTEVFTEVESTPRRLLPIPDPDTYQSG